MSISGEHNLQILRGLRSFGILLSCSEDGTCVDLWPEDDGSGRQRWTFTPIDVIDEQVIYNITVENGLTSDRKYLSCTEDGCKVDLWSVDDGSGRQRWKISSVTNSTTCNTYKIEVYKGVSSDRKYLSCTEDGCKVDLWSVDDGSGRQRWQFQGVWEA